MSEEEKIFRDILREKGFDDAKIMNMITAIGKLKETGSLDLLAKFLASENLGNVSEEKVLNNGNGEIPFSKLETSTTMGIDGEIQENKKETFYTSTGNVKGEIAVIDKHGHKLVDHSWYECKVCLQYCCKLCGVFSLDKYGAIAIARHRECVLCECCNRPSNFLDDFSDMVFRKDEYGNIVKAWHKKCKLSYRIFQFLFLENESRRRK